MIARVALRLRRDVLRTGMREAVGREAATRAVDALAERENGGGDTLDEKLTTDEPPSGLSRDM